jgi:allantoinase
MPLNASPPTLDAASFAAKRAAAEESSVVDFALWGGLTPVNLDRLDELAEAGAVGFKAFMANSGIDDFPAADDDTLAAGMAIAARLGLPVAVHAEDDALTRHPLGGASRRLRPIGWRDYVRSRPVVAETAAIGRAVALAAATGCSLHVVHVSSGAGLALVAEARARGQDVSAETCPHYLALTEGDLERIGAAAKCAPPLRPASEVEALWAAVVAGEVQTVGSDHSPAPADLKEGADAFAIWGGIAGVQSTLPLVLTEGHHARGVPLALLANMLAAAPAARLRLPSKGRIVPGMDADLALVDLGREWMLGRDDLLDRHRLSPYVGRAFKGAVRRTIVRGRTICADGKVLAEAGGRFLRPAPRH